jgi:hypothetical protein
LTPRYGRASASTAGSDDYVTLDDMEHAPGGLGEAATDRMSAFARRVGEDLARQVRAELDKRGAAEMAKTAGLGVTEIGVAGVLGLGAIGATTAAMIVGLNKLMPAWASSLVAAGVFVIPAGILASRGARHVKVLAAIGSPANP